MFEWLLLSNYCVIVAQTIYAWRATRGRMGVNNVSKIGEQTMQASFDAETHTYHDPESWPSISNVTAREVSKCVHFLKFPRIIRQVITEWVDQGRELNVLYETSKRYEWEMGFVPFARYLEHREEDDILTSLRSLIEFCERYIKATAPTPQGDKDDEETAFAKMMFEDGVDGALYRTAVSSTSSGMMYIYPDIRIIRAYLDISPEPEEGEKSTASKRKDGGVDPLAFFQSNLIKNHYSKKIPFLQDVIVKSGHNVSILPHMLHDIYCSLNVQDTFQRKKQRVVGDRALDALFGIHSKYSLRKRKLLAMEEPKMLREGETIRLPLRMLFKCDHDVHPPRTRAIHILSSVKLGMRNDGVYCVSVERLDKGRRFALKVKIGTSPDYKDMLPYYQALEQAIVGIPSDGYIHTYENVTWNVPFLDGGVNFTLSEWIEGRYLGDVIREKKTASPHCPYCTPGITLTSGDDDDIESVNTDAHPPPPLCQEHRDIRYYVTILRTLYRMHCRGVAHMDILPQNIIVHETRGPVIIDLDSAFHIPDEIDWRKYCLRDIRDASHMFRGFIYQQDFVEAFPLWDFDNPRPPHIRREGYKEDEALFERIITQLRWNRWSNQLAFPDNLFNLAQPQVEADGDMFMESIHPLSLTISDDLLMTRTSSDMEFYMHDEAMLSELDITARHSLALYA